MKGTTYGAGGEEKNNHIQISNFFYIFSNGDPVGRRSYATSDTQCEIQTKQNKNQKASGDEFPTTRRLGGMWTRVSNSRGFHNEAQTKLREALLVTFVGKYLCSSLR